MVVHLAFAVVTVDAQGRINIGSQTLQVHKPIYANTGQLTAKYSQLVLLRSVLQHLVQLPGSYGSGTTTPVISVDAYW
jgi:hypothetical protein